ncbi:MAG TPA: TIGR01777 family oxidoreductase [Polyangiaceae bacterium]|nr:TIGR01777 family oxidoreductase [Polyangiaceae bacterium]
MQKIVISGGTGFIGRAVVRALLARGDDVTVLTRDPERAAGNAPARARFESWASEGDAFPKSIVGSSAVIHLAGHPAVGARWSQKVKQEIIESRVSSTERLVAAMRAADVRPDVFVCASAIGYYGAHQDEPLDETSPPGDGFLARVTVEWESAAAQAEALGVRVVRLRFGIVLGRGGGALSEMVKPFKLFVGGPIASGRQIVSWVHLDDVVGVIVRAVDDPRLHGPVNVTAPNAVTNEELSRVIGKVLHRPSAMRVPAAALRVRFGEGADPLVTGQRAVPKVLERLGYAFRFVRVEDAVRDAVGDTPS